MGVELIPVIIGAVSSLASAGVAIHGAVKGAPKTPQITAVDEQKEKEEKAKRLRIQRALALGQGGTVLSNPFGSQQPLGSTRTIPGLTGR